MTNKKRVRKPQPMIIGWRWCKKCKENRIILWKNTGVPNIPPYPKTCIPCGGKKAILVAKRVNLGTVLNKDGTRSYI